MGKKVYRVKPGDDFIKISRKLYGDPSYVMDLLRANPGFHRVGPGMVLRLPKTDPRITRERKMKRRLKKYGPPPEETKDPLDQSSLPLDEEGLSEIDRLEMGYSEDPGAATSQGGESLNWWDDPAFEKEMADLFAETALSTGMDANTLREELGLGEGVSASSDVAEETSGSSPKVFKPAEPHLEDNEWDEPDVAEGSVTTQQPQSPPPPDTEISIRDVRDEDMLAAWYEEQKKLAGEDRDKIHEIELARLDKREELQERELGRPVERKDVVQLGTVEIQKSNNESTNDWRLRSTKIVEDYEYLVYYGLREGGVFYPEGDFLTHSGFGNGFEGWDPYYIAWAERNVAQNMSPHQLVSDEIEDLHDKDLKDQYHTNLCGQLAIIAALGLALEDGMNIFARDVPQGYDILRDNLTTEHGDLINFIDAAGGDQFGSGYYKRGSDAIDTPEEFIEHLEAGNKIISLVNIDTSRHGQLMDLASSGQDAPHWVLVQDIITTRNNETLVRVYNPYMNREEVYDWATFAGAYVETTGSSYANTSVVAPSNNP